MNAQPGLQPGVCPKEILLLKEGEICFCINIHKKIAEGKHSKMSGKASWSFPGRACFAASLSVSSEQLSKAAPTPTAAGDPFHLKKEALTIESSHLPYKALQGESILLWTYIVVPSNDIPKFLERDWSPLTALHIVNKTGKKMGEDSF